MKNRFKIDIEGNSFVITDNTTGKIIYCNNGELNSVLYELMEE